MDAAGPGDVDRPPLAVTMGDPAGIGPELVLRAFLDRQSLNLPPFVVVGDPALMRARAAHLEMPVEIEAVSADGCCAPATSLAVVDIGHSVSRAPGRLTADGAKAARAAIEAAVAMVRSDQAAAIVTNPINKANLKAVGFSHPGHTEFLAALAAQDGPPPHPVMMLASDDFRVVPVTVHIPLRLVPETLTTALIIKAGAIVADGLRRDFGIPTPRLAVAGLNPHAGEGGMLGLEDDAVIAPAVAGLQEMGIAATGPLPADTMFHAEARLSYDAALCMYHDQALIPIKTIAFDDAVNVTLGLPFVRTSPDHGTALDIAGKGIARANSLIAAIRMAARMADRRRAAALSETMQSQT